MRLLNKNGVEAKVGDRLTTFRGEQFTLMEIEKPKSEASTGRIYVRAEGERYDVGFYPSVCDLHWES